MPLSKQALRPISLPAFHRQRLRRFAARPCGRVLNAGSHSTALRPCFRFLNHLIVKGRSRDTAWFSLTDEEWHAVSDARARWFVPENFDADGRQKVSLSELTRALW